MAKSNGIREGAVKIQYTVLSTGLVSGIEVMELTGDPRWIQAVTSTVQRWKYKASPKE
ncbi:energy transducer TonB [Simiduia agarivorans]|uniref:energy transducer TonB n=1 Tax=Simiduia agarivorans TaxID=447471 RepID=UPI0009DBE90B